MVCVPITDEALGYSLLFKMFSQDKNKTVACYKCKQQTSMLFLCEQCSNSLNQLAHATM